MRIKETKVYSFAELSESAKEKAIDRLCNINVDFNWWDCTYDNLKELGIKVNSFDLGRRQEIDITVQDYRTTAEGFILDGWEKFLKSSQEFLDQMEDIDSKIIRPLDWPEGCEDEFPWSNTYNAMWDELADEYENEYHDELKFLIFSMLHSEYEYLTSREAIIETININNYEFTEDGRLA